MGKGWERGEGSRWEKGHGLHAMVVPRECWQGLGFGFSSSVIPFVLPPWLYFPPPTPNTCSPWKCKNSALASGRSLSRESPPQLIYTPGLGVCSHKKNAIPPSLPEEKQRGVRYVHVMSCPCHVISFRSWACCVVYHVVCTCARTSFGKPRLCNTRCQDCEMRLAVPT